jgi:hypothetical protein
MSSARHTCPECGDGGSAVVDLQDILYSPRVDFFRCRSCLCWWMVPKGEDEPATLVILGNPAAAMAVSKKAG